MDAHVRAGAPPGKKSKTLVGQDQGFVKLHCIGLALQLDDNMELARWRACNRRRTLRCKPYRLRENVEVLG